jgi:hypothetical protein
MSVSLTGKDTIIFNSRILSDLADGDTAVLDVPNNIAEGKVGKNGNILIAFNATGKTVNANIRILLGSPDDKFFNSLLAAYINDSASFALIEGEFIKRVGDGTGKVNNVTYKMGQGFIQKLPTVKENQEGDTEQSVAVWAVTFPNTDRSIT